MTSRLRALLTLSVLTLAPASAQAIPYYVEFGGGMASANKADPVLSSTASTLQNAAVGQLTLGFMLQERMNGVLFHLAVQQRYLGGTAGGESVQALPTYGLFRIELWRLVLGAGYTPFIWKDSFSGKNAGASSFMAEATLLFPITVEIDFALQGAAEYMKTSAGQGPSPSYEGLALFRLNFGFSEGQRSARRKYKGWRYPFGNPNF